MGGIGKTTLAARLVQEVAPSFERAYWRSVRNAPSLGEWLGGAISFLSDHQLTAPDGDAAQVALLLQLLRERRCLLALDNLETLLQPGEHQARYRDGYAGYGSLVQVLGESRHQSCLVLTSREAPPELATLGSGPAVRALGLGGLGVAEAQALLSDKHLSGDEAGWAQLVGKYGGNGLALKLAAETIYQVFGGDIASFINLEQAGPGTTLGGIRRLLETQVEQRLSHLEQDLLRWIAIEREPVALAKLLTELGPSVGRSGASAAGVAGTLAGERAGGGRLRSGQCCQPAPASARRSERSRSLTVEPPPGLPAGRGPTGCHPGRHPRIRSGARRGVQLSDV